MRPGVTSPKPRAGSRRQGEGAELDQDFDAFYMATHRRIVSHVYAMTGSLHEAEDCVQEAYARAWERWASLTTGVGSPEAWVRAVAARLAVSSWRKAVNRLKAHRRELRATEVSGMNPDQIAIIAALRKISADQRMAIVLYHYAGLSVEEIAIETGVTISTVKARLARGRKALAPHLTEFADSIEKPRTPRSPGRVQLSPKGM